MEDVIVSSATAILTATTIFGLSALVNELVSDPIEVIFHSFINNIAISCQSLLKRTLTLGGKGPFPQVCIFSRGWAKWGLGRESAIPNDFHGFLARRRRNFCFRNIAKNTECNAPPPPMKFPSPQKNCSPPEKNTH